jgi:hypothetical protein
MRIEAEHRPDRPRARRGVWAEHLDPTALRDPALLRLLARHGVELVAAVRPGDLREVPSLVAAARSHAVPLSLWPMLDDADGRWLSAANADVFTAYCRDLAEVIANEPGPLPAIVLDLEPPIARMRRFIDHPLASLVRRPRAPSPDLGGIVGILQDAGVQPWAAIVPLVAADPVQSDGPARPRGWQRLLETPIDRHPFARVSAMLYSSLAQGYSRGLLSRDDVRAVLFEAARACARRFGARASASVGAVGPGALGDERTYDSPEHLADDVALVRAAGIDDITLFELAGILDRPPPERWLDALRHTAPALAVPHRSRRALLAIGLAIGIGRL